MTKNNPELADILKYATTGMRKRDAYYTKEFSAFFRGEKYWSWNWSAFILVEFWGVYRKLFLYTITFELFYWTIYTLLNTLYPLLAAFWGLYICLLWGGFSNYAYFILCSRRSRQKLVVKKNITYTHILHILHIMFLLICIFSWAAALTE